MSSETQTQETAKENEDEFSSCQRKGRRDACVDIECPCKIRKNGESSAGNGAHTDCCVHSKQSQADSIDKKDD